MLYSPESKIKISKISPKCYLQKGFDFRGCYGCNCHDSCCRYGADFDKESYQLVIAHKNLIEPLVGQEIEKCFENNFIHDQEYLGMDAIRSLKGENGFCIFHKKNGKGCILYELVIEKKAEARIIPSICRLFPLTWNHGELIICDEQQNSNIPEDCNCKEVANTTLQKILETQKNYIIDIFDLDYSIAN